MSTDTAEHQDKSFYEIESRIALNLLGAIEVGHDTHTNIANYNDFLGAISARQEIRRRQVELDAFVKSASQEVAS